jgi:hypothetical protein
MSNHLYFKDYGALCFEFYFMIGSFVIYIEIWDCLGDTVLATAIDFFYFFLVWLRFLCSLSQVV